jgi:hydroxyethylthiazole kinase
MKSAMHAAKAARVPIVFDPVGAGASTFRSWTCKKLLNAAHPAVIRGNASEIMALLDSDVQTKGVDSSASSDAAAESASAIAKRYKCVVSVSGETDIITDGSQVLRIHNGHLMMTRVTGLGCTASALTGAFAAINPNPLHAAAHAMAVMGIAGELAVAKSAGPGTLQLHFYDALYNLTQEQIETMLR